jgi:hypothetical protein
MSPTPLPASARNALPTPVNGPSSQRQAFVMLLSVGCLVASITHVAFGYLFWRHDVIPMAWGNVASVLAYALSALLLRQGHTATAIVLMLAEVTGHALAAVVTVGWESGFHFYLIIVIPMFLANQVNRLPVRLLLAAGVAIAYMLLDVHGHHRVALHPMPEPVLAALHTFNLGSTLAILCVFTVVYVQLISEAEARLHELATTDSLTGLMNRRSMGTALQRLQTLQTDQRSPWPRPGGLGAAGRGRRAGDRRARCGPAVPMGRRRVPHRPARCRCGCGHAGGRTPAPEHRGAALPCAQHRIWRERQPRRTARDRHLRRGRPRAR